jgi:hypothetical protein
VTPLNYKFDNVEVSRLWVEKEQHLMLS